MPRKTKLTPELQQLIVDALSVGATHRIACEYAGIHQDTFYFWLQKGAAGKPPYSEFSEAVIRTQGRAAVGWLAKIEAAANAGDWKAVAWKLERRYPEEYGRINVSVDGTVKVNIQVQQQEQQQLAQQFTDRLNEIRSRTLSVTSTEVALPNGTIPA